MVRKARDKPSRLCLGQRMPDLAFPKPQTAVPWRFPTHSTRAKRQKVRSSSGQNVTKCK